MDVLARCLVIASHGARCVREAGHDGPHSTAAGSRWHESELESLREQLEGAVDLVRELGARWREGDMKGAGKALARLEEAVGLREQEGQYAADAAGERGTDWNPEPSDARRSPREGEQ